ncbi:MAG TPA: type II toxin-antitoxin system VapC family toxin [Vicinamibacterales bacterium]|nr:type II toxin-antitoxin system VapC family toxin [Vicinamibacterales bacterium]
MARTDVDERDLLLDTHALLWWAAGDRALSRKVARFLEDHEVTIYASAATAWEIATKVRLGKVKWTSPDSVETYCLEQGFTLMPVTFAQAQRAGSWPQAHGDPFDRLLAAQSDLENIPLATNDPKIKTFGIRTIW